MNNIAVGISMLALGALIALGVLASDGNVLPWFSFPLGAAVLVVIALRASRYDRYSYLLCAVGLAVSAVTAQRFIRGLTWAVCGALLLALSVEHRAASPSESTRRVPVWLLWIIGIVVVSLVLFSGL
jgi:hypothetical protein